jgi:DNA-binding beta-propeller fold protein YncE
MPTSPSSRRDRRPLDRAARDLIPAFAVLLLVGCQSGGGGGGGGGGGSVIRPGDVSGRYIVSISDADMPATALVDNQLGARDPKIVDSLTVISLPIRAPETPWAQINVSNSVIGPPNALSVSRDGKIAVVIESKGPAPAGATTTAQLPKGEKLSGVDMSDPVHPAVFATATIGDNPTAVDIHPSGDLVVAVCGTPREQINIIPLIKTKGARPAFGEPLGWPLVGLDDDEAVPSCVAWHPSGDFLAVTIPSRNQVMFYRFTKDANDGTLGLLPWGSPVAVGKYPYSGKFTPDGRFFITTEMQWGNDVPGFMIESPQGKLSVIRFDAGPAGAPTAQTHPEHQVVSSVSVGVNPEGLAISPDGSLVVTANLQRSFLPENDARVTRGGSISLLSLNKSTGLLTPAGEYPMKGMPVGLSFDAQGRFVVCTQFRSFDPRAIDGELAFWRVNRKSAAPSLEDAMFVVGVGKGPHGVLIIR